MVAKMAHNGSASAVPTGFPLIWSPPSKRRTDWPAGPWGFTPIAKDNEAQRFYEHFNFDPSPADQHQLFLVMKDLKRMVSASGQMPCSFYANPEFGHPTETMCPKVESMIALIM